MTFPRLRVWGSAIILAIMGGPAITWLSGFLHPLLPEKTIDVLPWGSPFPYLHKFVTFPGLHVSTGPSPLLIFSSGPSCFLIIIYAVWISHCRDG